MAQLNHIGIAVENPAALRKLFSILGTEISYVETVADQGVRAHFLPLSVPLAAFSQAADAGSVDADPQNSNELPHLELLEPIDPEGPVAQFMKKRGAGVHHLAFSVMKGELDAICGRLRAEGYRLIYDSPRLGAHRLRVNFIHPASAGGVLIELTEPVQ